MQIDSEKMEIRSWINKQYEYAWCLDGQEVHVGVEMWLPFGVETIKYCRKAEAEMWNYFELQHKAYVGALLFFFLH